MSLNLKSFPQKDEALNWSCKMLNYQEYISFYIYDSSAESTRL